MDLLESDELVALTVIPEDTINYLGTSDKSKYNMNKVKVIDYPFKLLTISYAEIYL